MVETISSLRIQFENIESLREIKREKERERERERERQTDRQTDRQRAFAASNNIQK